MEVSKRRGCVVAGSVWESRMKSDEVRGGIKVFKAEQNPQEEGKAIANDASKLRSRNSIGKRKTWKPEEECKEVISSSSPSSSNGIKKSPRKIGGCAERVERKPIQMRKLRSDAQKGGGEGQLRKNKSDPIKKNGSESDSIEMRKTKSSDLDEIEDEARKEEVVDNCENEKIEVEIEKEVDACHCEEKEISSSLSSDNVGVVQVGGDSDDDDDDVIIDDDEEEEEEEEEEVVVVVDEENENEKERFEVKEISSIPESKKVVVVKEPEVEGEAEAEQKKVINEAEAKKVVSANMRFPIRKNETRPVSVPHPHPVKQSPATRLRRNSTIYPPNSIPKADEDHHRSSFPETQSKLQSLVDLIMWRDVSRSAFVFGIGTFIIISSSYAKDVNISLISALSYLALVYLALIFLYRSLICRGIMIDVEKSSYVVGEEDAIWMLKLILPYLNEFLSKLKALFSGDPGTTIKMAVSLFVLARCGSFITVWKMARFGFFGVFTVPIICSSYSAQLSAYGNFWIRRFRDAWDSCTHKKAVALGIFGLVWNLSSVVARIWAVFVLFVAFRYYQQHYLVRDEWVEDGDETWQEPISVGVREKEGRAGNFIGTNKVKKGF